MTTSFLLLVSFAHPLPCLRTLRRGGLSALYGLGCAGHCRAHAGRVEYYRIADRKMATLCFRPAGMRRFWAFPCVQIFVIWTRFLAARDPIAIREMSDWLHEHPEPYKRLVWSNARMCIVSGLTLVQSPSLRSSSREATLALLRDAPSGTLVFWDDHFGPDWFGLTADGH